MFTGIKCPAFTVAKIQKSAGGSPWPFRTDIKQKILKSKEFSSILLYYQTLLGCLEALSRGPLSLAEAFFGQALFSSTSHFGMPLIMGLSVTLDMQ